MWVVPSAGGPLLLPPTAKQDGGTYQILVNPTKVFDHQSHPVVIFAQKLSKMYTENKGQS